MDPSSVIKYKLELIMKFSKILLYLQSRIYPAQMLFVRTYLINAIVVVTSYGHTMSRAYLLRLVLAALSFLRHSNIVSSDLYLFIVEEGRFLGNLGRWIVGNASLINTHNMYNSHNYQEYVNIYELSNCLRVFRMTK